MPPRELYFATYHQAAHAVVAMTLGCRVEHVEIGMVPEDVGWCLDTAPSGDFETVCAAGFAMELILGRRHDAAWDHCKDDRALMANLCVDRTGVAMDAPASVERFMEGAAHCRAILAHPAVRTAIDDLSESLADAYLAGEERVEGDALGHVSDALVGTVGADGMRSSR
jgi:hypothetical protein